MSSPDTRFPFRRLSVSGNPRKLASFHISAFRLSKVADQFNRRTLPASKGASNQRLYPAPCPVNESNMDRKNKPSAIPVSPSLPQPLVEISADNILTATLPSHDSVTVHLYGATVTSWKTSNGTEQLFLSEKAVLDGSKAIRGGIPVVFPVFGPPPKDHATSALHKHGFARTSLWEYLGKSTSESTSSKADDSVKLDFGLSTTMLDEKARKAWPYDFGLVYSVTLGNGTLETSMHVQNKGDESFDFQCLFHTYLRIKVRLRTA